MNKWDVLWVGLKILGAYFIVSGVASGGYGLYQLLRIGLKAPEAFDFTPELWRLEAYRILIQAALHVAGGLLLVFGTAMFVREDRRDKPDDSSFYDSTSVKPK